MMTTVSSMAADQEEAMHPDILGDRSHTLTAPCTTSTLLRYGFLLFRSVKEDLWRYRG